MRYEVADLPQKQKGKIKEFSFKEGRSE